MDYKKIFLSFVDSITLALEIRDFVTVGHSRRVSLFIDEITKQLDLSKNDQEKFKLAGLLHDLGKIGIPENILFKYSQLTDDEFQIIKKHPILSYEILNKIELPKELSDLPLLVLSHHELLDGSGYPHGIKDIPLGSRIITVCDIFDALSSRRQYRRRADITEILQIFDEESKVKLDIDIINKFKKIKLNRIIQILEEDDTIETGLGDNDLNDLIFKEVSRKFEVYYSKKYLLERTNVFLKKYMEKR